MFFFTTAGSAEWNSHDAAAAPEHDAGVGELLLHVLALVGRERRLDAVLVRGAALDGGDADLLADLQEGGQSPSPLGTL